MPIDVNEIVNATIREHIRNCGNHFGSVLFFKKDGTLRRLTFHVASGPKHVRGTELGKRMAATRAVNHPNLLSIRDVHKQDWRSINLDTVLTVQSGGTLMRYRQAVPVPGIPGAWELLPALRIRAGIDDRVLSLKVTR